MSTFAHTQGLSRVSFNKTITVYCPLGKDFYTATISVELKPNQVMFDYLDVEKFFKELQGQQLIIEDLTDTVFKYFTEFDPINLKISVYAENATHFPVTVIKEK